ncbi:hypothetical protein GCM10009753_03430 [Streptantibioticus ferralitis]
MVQQGGRGAVLAESGMDVPPGDRHLTDPDAWRARRKSVAQQRAEALSAGRRAQATAAPADAEVRARFASLPDKPRPSRVLVKSQYSNPALFISDARARLRAWPGRRGLPRPIAHLRPR